MANTRSSIGSRCRGPPAQVARSRPLQARSSRPGALRILVRREHPIAVGEQLAAEALGEQREPAGVVGASRLDELGLVGADRTRRSVFGRIYAAGDVIGPPELASVSMEQGRVAACCAFGIPSKETVDPLPPYGVYSIPEAAMVGMTEAAASQQGIDITFNVPTFSRHTSTPPTTDSKRLKQATVIRPPERGDG